MPKQAVKTPEKNLLDVFVDAPEGATPAKLHIVLNKKFKGYADQYKNALFLARGIPFSQSTVAMTDPLAMIYSRSLETEEPDDKKRAQRAIQMAIGTYNRWAEKAEEEAWTLAMLTDNIFTGDPEPYEDESESLPGLMPEINPTRNLNNQTEKRLKLILDYLNIDIMFRVEVEQVINGAIAEAIKLVETDAAGFRSGGIN